MYLDRTLIIHQGILSIVMKYGSIMKEYHSNKMELFFLKKAQKRNNKLGFF